MKQRDLMQHVEKDDFAQDCQGPVAWMACRHDGAVPTCLC